MGRKVDRMEVGLKYPGSLVRRSFKVVLAKRMRVVALWSSPCLILERSWIHIPLGAGLLCFLYLPLTVSLLSRPLEEVLHY